MGQQGPAGFGTVAARRGAWDPPAVNASDAAPPGDQPPPAADGAGTPSPGPPSTPARLVAPALLAAILLIAAAARFAGSSGTLSTGELIPPDDDSTYHLHRMTQGARSLPLPAFDPWMNWPAGAIVPWADGFDLVGAAVMRAAGGIAAPERSAIAVGLLPVVLGLLGVWATWALAARLAPAHATGAAAAAALVVAVLPQAVAPSLYARLDHHVLEALSLLLLALWAMAPWWRPPGAEGTRGAILRDELGAASASTLAVAGFAGGTLYVALALAVRIAALMASPRPRLAGSGCAGLTLGAAATALLTWPGIRARGLALAFDGPSLLQPVLLLAAAAALALTVLVARRAGASQARRLAVAAGATLATAAVALAVPAIRAAISDGLLRFVLRRDPWLAGIQEFQPMLDGSPPAKQLNFFYGSVGVLAPALAAAGVTFAVRARRSTGLAFGFLLLGTAVLALVQVRFGRVLAPMLAVAAGLSLAWLGSAIAARVLPLARAAAPITVLLALALVTGDPRLRRAFTRAPISATPAAEAAIDLRGAPLDPARPGIHSAWELGHGLSVVGRRPALTNGFGAFLDRAAFLESEQAFSLTPGQYEAFLDRRRAGIVVAGPATFRARSGEGRTWIAFRQDGAVLDTTFMRSVPLSPLLIAGSAVPGADVRHLEHLMPRFASTMLVDGLKFDLPRLWSYERVAGARLRGRTAPGARVVASIPLMERGRRHQWRAFTDADAGGAWELTLPVPSALVRPSLQTGASYELRAGRGAPVALELPESAVRSGATLEVARPLPYVAEPR
jgi:asparagine N-glycosylation enzyme membrane subunit Stt3